MERGQDTVSDGLCRTGGAEDVPAVGDKAQGRDGPGWAAWRHEGLKLAPVYGTALGVDSIALHLMVSLRT